MLGPPELRSRLDALDPAGGPGRWDAVRFEPLTGSEGERDLGGGMTLRYRQVPHLPPTFALRSTRAAAPSASAPTASTTTTLPALAAEADVLLCECSFGADPVPDGVMHLNGARPGASPPAPARGACC